MISFIVFIFILIMLTLSFRGDGPTYKIVPAEAIEDLIQNPETTIIDVRTAHEYKFGHIPNSVNLDYYAQDFAEKISSLDPSKPYVVHCKNGERSIKACKILEDHGFTMVQNMKDGLEAWKLKGGELEKL